MENRIDNLEDKIRKLESCKDKHESKIEALDRAVLEIRVGSKKDFDLIFTMLREIKDSVERVNTEVNNIKMEPADKWKTTMSTALKVIVTAIVTYTMTKGGF